MSNHYHLVLRARRANLSRLMRYLNGVYTQRYNRRHGKVGHLYQGCFKGILVQEDAYLREVCRYVDLNPVRAHMVEHPEEWPWSSYAALTGEAPPPSWHNRATVLAMVAPNKGMRAAQNAYARFMAQGRGVNLWQSGDMRGQIILGDERKAGSGLAFCLPLHYLYEYQQQEQGGKPCPDHYAWSSRGPCITSRLAGTGVRISLTMMTTG